MEGLKSVLIDLPKQVANATAAAVRAFDLAEEGKASAAATRQSAAPFVAKIDACKNCFDIGKLEGFRFDVRHGDIVCICCFRYASSNYVPQALRARTARNVGVIAGVRDSSTHGVVRGSVLLRLQSNSMCRPRFISGAPTTRLSSRSMLVSAVGLASSSVSRSYIQALAPLTTHHPHCIAHTRTRTCTCTHMHKHMHMHHPAAVPFINRALEN